MKKFIFVLATSILGFAAAQATQPKAQPQLQGSCCEVVKSCCVPGASCCE